MPVFHAPTGVPRARVARQILSAVVAVAALSACSGGRRSATSTTEPVTDVVTLTVAGTGNGSGRITSTPAGIDCTFSAGNNSGTCAARFPAGTVVTLAQEAQRGTEFAGWSTTCVGNSCSITLSTQRTIELTFRAVSAPGTVAVIGAGTGTGLVTSVPDGITCTVTAGVTSGTCSASFAAGSTVALNAAATANGSMTGFTGACTAAPCLVTVASAQTSTVGVAFAEAPPATLTVSPSLASRGSGVITSSPAGINCTVDNGVTTGVCSVTFAGNTVVTLTQAPVGNSIFQGWGGQCIGNPCQVTMTQGRAAEVTYRVPPPGTISLTGIGTGSGVITSAPSGLACTIATGVATGTCSAAFDAGSTVTLTAAGTANASFDGFTGGCTGVTCSLTMQSNVTTPVVAGFTAAPQRLTVAAGSGSAGTGVITSSPAGISCTVSGTSSSGTCSATFPINTVVTLLQSPSGNAVFNAWSGDCTTEPCQVTMSQPRTALAVFQTQGVIISGAGSGTGTIASSPAGINCTVTAGTLSGTCSATFPANATVTLTATPSGLATFTAFSGACTGTTCTLPMATGTMRAVTAQFTAPPTLSIIAANGSAGGGTITTTPTGVNCTIANSAGVGTCTAAYAQSSVVAVTQVPSDGSVFLNWAGSCSGSGPCQVTLNQSRTVQVNYRLAVPGAVTISAGAGFGSGTVFTTPGGVACTIANRVRTGTCRANFQVGATVTISAIANSGSTFTGFSGACTGMTCTVTVPENSDIAVTANFTTP
jgi:hypothetical protein